MLLALFFGQPMHLFAQNEEKLSAATYFFLKDRDAKDINKPTIKVKDITPDLDLSTLDLKGKRIEPLYAKPDTIDGKVYMSSFVRLENENSTSALEAKGVIVQGVFKNGLITALIPVDSIEAVATIANVKKVSVGRRMSLQTKMARTATNADDVLTQSPDAIAAGIQSKYDGTGVVLGVIDTGIDFQHIAFKDKNGNSRIKRAYVYNGSKDTEYTSITSGSPTTDDASEDHGTHTSSTAGGSSVKVSGSTVTVIDDHANATYGGMAPGADLLSKWKAIIQVVQGFAPGLAEANGADCELAIDDVFGLHEGIVAHRDISGPAGEHDHLTRSAILHCEQRKRVVDLVAPVVLAALVITHAVGL